ncbi:MAG TPA: TMEM175 family protein [Candidatus Dormibacteraeota bacterium]
MAAHTMEGEESAAAAAQAGPRDAYGTSRLLAFSDGVFAIAITLLVLSIPLPDLNPDAPDLNQQLIAALRNLLPFLAGFGLSFVLIGAHWIIHHRTLRGVARPDSRLLWLNLLILLGICLVPFATSLLLHYGRAPAATIAYAALQVWISLTYLALRIYLAGRDGGTLPSLTLGLIQLAGFAISIPVALVDVRAAYALWLAGVGAARVVEGRLRVSRG